MPRSAPTKKHDLKTNHFWLFLGSGPFSGRLLPSISTFLIYVGYTSNMVKTKSHFFFFFFCGWCVNRKTTNEKALKMKMLNFFTTTRQIATATATKTQGILRRFVVPTNGGKFQSTRPQCCLLYTSPSPRDRQKSRMPSSA